MQHATTPQLLDRLRAGLTGTVLTPDDPDFDRLRTIVTPVYDERPALLVRAASAADVVRAVELARTTGVDLAIRSGGHSGAGHGSVPGGIVIDVRPLDRLDVDVAGRTATVGTGVTAGEYTTAVVRHGLATGFGDTGSVGLGGLTLGGGVGYLARRHGLTIDSLLAAEVVTADGRVLEVDHDHHPDLFWAIRGGGGNFGVATRLTFRLHDVSAFTGGLLLLPATGPVVAALLAEAAAAPPGLTTILNVMPCPPMPFAPGDVVGRLVVMAMVAWAGDPAEGERVVGRLRAVAPPLADLVRPASYAEMFPPEDDSYRPTAVARTLFTDELDEPLADEVVAALEASDAPMRVAQLRVLGGAVAEVPDDATAYAHRRAPIMANVAAFYDGPEDMGPKAAWVDALAARLDRTGAAYVNFLGREGADRVRAAYPGATWDRLRAVKRAYDPENLFHVNQNVPPLP